MVYSQYASAYPFHRTVPLDLSDKWEEAPTEATLRTAAEAFVNSSELGLPKVSIKVSFVALWQSEEYKDVLPLQRVKLCDEITVVFEKYGISRVAKIVKTTYNVLKELLVPYLMHQFPILNHPHRGGEYTIQLFIHNI